MKLNVLAFFWGLAALTTIYAAEINSNEDFTSIEDAIIARVNGEPILLSQLKEAALDQSIPLEDLTQAAMLSEGWRRAISIVIDETLLVQKARADGFSVNDAELAKEVDAMISELRAKLGSQRALETFFKERALDLDRFKRMLAERERRKTMIIQLIAQRVTITADDLTKFQKQRLEQHLPLELVHLAQIFIECPAKIQDQQEGDRRYRFALDIVDQIMEGQRAEDLYTAFAHAAQRYSDDDTGALLGGDLGWLDPLTLDPKLQRIVKDMRSSGVSPPIVTDRGYHILMLIGRRKLRDIYYMEAFEAQRTQLVERLRESASIAIYDQSELGR